MFGALLFTQRCFEEQIFAQRFFVERYLVNEVWQMDISPNDDDTPMPFQRSYVKPILRHLNKISYQSCKCCRYIRNLE
jgi:hypothetical protein